jgi:PTH1 family peptidyl-tRNA hydrolase
VKLIVGLGNPGKIYVGSRHNLGYFIIKELASSHKVLVKKENGIAAFSARAKFEGQNIILALPVTFMNLSGSAVKALLKRYKIDLSSLLIVHDDLDLEFGRLKIKTEGSAGGHNGLKSIIDSLGTHEFCRLRVGIGRPAVNKDITEFVLSPFYKEEKKKLKGIIEDAVICCRVWATTGATASMNSFNRRKP